ncbi:MAG: amidase [Rhodocyclales bacterium]|nr:amidase [Rhodocyclales bacterium]
MGFADFDHYDGLGLAELVRSGRVAALDLVDEAIGRVEERNPPLNAVIRPMFDSARAAAARPGQGPFAGVPFLIKDLVASCAGVPTSCGGRLMRDFPMPVDSELVRRYRAAGLLPIGKTNTPEFGLAPYTEPEAFGPTLNPWDRGRTPGGSSGGTAAAVAARMVPCGHGGDGGGSIRIPASCCGLFGMKPSRGRNPTGPNFGEIWHGLVCEHVLTRSVRDSAALLDATAGPDIGAPYAAAPPARPWLAEVAAGPGRLRIAWTGHSFFGGKVDPACVTALAEAADLLRSLGHELVEAAPAVDAEAWSTAFITVLAVETRADIERVAAAIGRRPAGRDFEAATWTIGLVGGSLGAAEYAAAVNTLQLANRGIGAFFEDWDVLLTPTLAAPPPLIGSMQPGAAERALMAIVGPLRAGWLLKALGAIRMMAAKGFDFSPFTPLFNATGQPAMSVPLHWTAAGLPVGMQFVGRHGDEATLFRLAGQLERARPWFDRAPPGY